MKLMVSWRNICKMRELSLHILDLIQNSITAGASIIRLTITEDTNQNSFSFTIEDNGKGMSKEFLRMVEDPFITSRTTRKVGMGISLTKAACEACDGKLSLKSEEGIGTKLTATFVYNHIDRQPLGDIAQTVSSLIMMNETIDFIYIHTYNGKTFDLDTREIKQTLGEVSISNLEIIEWIKEYINENLNEIYGGAVN